MTFWDIISKPPPKPEIPGFEHFVNHLDAGITKWLAAQVLWASKAISSLLLTTPTEFLQSKVFHDIYSMTTMIAYAAILPTVGWIGFKALCGKMEPNDVFRSLGKLAIVPVGVALIPTLVIIFLKVMNSLSSVLLAAAPTLKPEQILAPTGLDIGLIVFIIIYLILLVRLLLFYCYRNYAVVVMVALAPLLLLSYVTGVSHRLERWAHELTTLLITQGVHALQLVLLTLFTIFTGARTEPGIPLILIQIGALMYMTKTPAWLADYVHPTPNPYEAVATVRRTIGMMDPTKIWRSIKNAAGLKK